MGGYFFFSILAGEQEIFVMDSEIKEMKDVMNPCREPKRLD